MIDTTTHFWLVRHGETDWNAARRLQGWQDIPLNPQGLLQARQVARHLASADFVTSISEIVSSDLSRALETARISAHELHLHVEQVPGLRERNYGVHEGCDWAHLNITAPGQGPNLRDPDQAIEGGETLREFQARVVASFNDLAQRHAGRNLLVFTHGGVIDIVWRHATRTPLGVPRPEPILNASINQFAIDEALHWALVHWGQAAHLDEVGSLDELR